MIDRGKWMIICLLWLVRCIKVVVVSWESLCWFVRLVGWEYGRLEGCLVVWLSWLLGIYWEIVWWYKVGLDSLLWDFVRWWVVCFFCWCVDCFGWISVVLIGGRCSRFLLMCWWVGWSREWMDNWDLFFVYIDREIVIVVCVWCRWRWCSWRCRMGYRGLLCRLWGWG